MNRQAFRSVSNAGHDDDAPMTAAGTAGPSTTETLSNAASSLAQDGKELADRTYSYAVRTLRENPTLALAGVVAVGALAVIAFKPRRTEPGTVARNVQRDLVKHTRDLRKIVRQELRDSGASDKFNNFSRALSNVDWKPYLQPIIDQASVAAQAATDRLAGKSKS